MSPVELLPTSPSPLAGAGADKTMANIFVYFLKGKNTLPSLTHCCQPNKAPHEQGKQKDEAGLKLLNKSDCFHLCSEDILMEIRWTEAGDRSSAQRSKSFSPWGWRRLETSQNLYCCCTPHIAAQLKFLPSSRCLQFAPNCTSKKKDEFPDSSHIGNSLMDQNLYGNINRLRS